MFLQSDGEESDNKVTFVSKSNSNTLTYLSIIPTISLDGENIDINSLGVPAIQSTSIYNVSRYIGITFNIPEGAPYNYKIGISNYLSNSDVSSIYEVIFNIDDNYEHIIDLTSGTISMNTDSDIEINDDFVDLSLPLFITIYEQY